MQKLIINTLAAAAIVMTGCNGAGNNSGSTTPSQPADSAAATTPAAQAQDAEQLQQAVNDKHFDTAAQYNYNNGTVTITKEVSIPAGQSEEDYAVTLVENEVPKFIADFKKSNSAGDVAIKAQGATVTVSLVNKATGEEITAFDITPDDLK